MPGREGEQEIQDMKKPPSNTCTQTQIRRAKWKTQKENKGGKHERTHIQLHKQDNFRNQGQAHGQENLEEKHHGHPPGQHLISKQ